MRQKTLIYYPKYIAIDGPAASGKSSIGGQLAQKLEYLFVNAGTMYRALTQEVLRQKVDINDAAGVAEVARGITFSASIIANGASVLRMNNRLFWEDELPSDLIQSVPIVAAHAEARALMREKQHHLVRLGRVVMVGRDIGTVVLPDAGVKIYLEADLEVRAFRRFKSLERKKYDIPLEAVRQDLESRDYMDTHRSVSPLRPADDAIVIDNTHMKIKILMDTVMKHVLEKARGAG